MVFRIKSVVEDEPTHFGARTQRRCIKSNIIKTLAISIFVFLMLMMSIVYHGLVLERMDKLRQIMILNERHQHYKNPVDTENMKLVKDIQLIVDDGNAETVDASLATAVSDDNEPSDFLSMQHFRMKFSRHKRIERDILDPIHEMSKEPNFARLYSKIRNKRAKIALSKLEKEYIRCKKQTPSSNDCMIAFVRMYNIAKDISEKMEKMKAIFKDSEMILQQNSNSDSNESKEDASTTPVTILEDIDQSTDHIDDDDDDDDDANVKLHESIELTTSENTNNNYVENTTATSTTKYPIVKVKKIKPIKISWIIDGHNDELDIYDAHKEPALITTTVRTIVPIEQFTETTSKSISTTTTTTMPTTALVPSTYPQFTILDDFVDSTTIIPSTTREQMTYVALDEIKLNNVSTEAPHQTTNNRDIFKELDTATDPIEMEEEQLRKLKYDWIIDDGGGDELSEVIVDSMNTTEITTISNPPGTVVRISNFTNQTSPVYPTKPKSIKISWILDSDANSVESNTTVSNVDRNFDDNEQNTIVPDTVIMAANHTNATVRYGHSCAIRHHSNGGVSLSNCSSEKFDVHKDDDVHPLDNPSSMENMVESHERLESEKFISDSKQASVKHAPKPQQELIDHFNEMDAKDMMMVMNNLGPKLNPANAKGFGTISDEQLITLCERMSKRIGTKSGAFPNASAVSVGDAENLTKPPGNQFTSRGPVGFPVTAETMKATGQFLNTPGFGLPSVPICFYVTPANYLMLNQAPLWTPSNFGIPAGFYGGPMGGSFMSGVGPNNVFFRPQVNFGSTGGFLGQGSGGTGGGQPNNLQNIFTKNASPQKQQQQQLYCTYMQNQGDSTTSNSHGVVNVNNGPANSVNSIGVSNANFKMRTLNQTSVTDIIYASYVVLPDHADHRQIFKCTLPDQVACYGGNECIRESSWCDGSVECSDGSDEAACTCRDRLPEDRLCDGYPDCPMSEDEIGCFGCENSMHSCYDNEAEYDRANRSIISMCYNTFEMCDGVKNCLNGRDEHDCSIIVGDAIHHMTRPVSSSEGYLYHNYHGEWYPVCNNGEKWAKEACVSEGVHIGAPNTTFTPVALPGPFIEPAMVGSAHFPQSCQKRDSHDKLVDHVSYVKCGPPKCGIVKRKHIEVSISFSTRAQRATAASRKRNLHENMDTVEKNNQRIVGGTHSKSLQWPFVVGLYRNGNFHCGGTIFTDRWIISAAHCVINYHKYYYEVRAGVLRRSSFSLATQIQPVSHVVVHQAYERRSMRNDLSLLRLIHPLKFNRWVKPICLPDVGRTTMKDDWIAGPDEKTLCTAVGWGAVREKGPGSDRLREVTVPIRKYCSEREDRQSQNICAGDVGGGRDACQGDSGGPLFCRSVANSDEWYLAGIVSHGNGCARVGEFGVYTRVALYLDWIEASTRPGMLPQLQPLQICPGYMCIWGGKHCIPLRKRCDRIVDCLGGEDEVGCTYNFIPDVGSTKNGSTTTSTTESDYFPENSALRSSFRLFENRENIDETENLDLKADLSTSTMSSSVDKSEVQQQQEAAIKSDDVDVVIVAESTTLSESLTTTTTTQHEHKLSFDVSPPFEAISLVTTAATNSLDEQQTESTNDIFQTTSIPSPFEEFQKLQELTKKVKQGENQQPITQATTESVEKVLLKNTTSASRKTTAKVPQTSASTTTLAPAIITLTSTVTVNTLSDDHTSVPQRPTTAIHTTPTPHKLMLNKFVCTKIPQIIDVSNRCDRLVDCEDGTDEENCQCRDFLKGPLGILICDGKADCNDLTDEENCESCKNNEFHCTQSNTCIISTKRCDGTIDCKYQEDEEDCYSLTDGRHIKLDANRKPILNHFGILSRNIQGIWRVSCFHNPPLDTYAKDIATKTCRILGFRGLKFHNISAQGSHNMIIVPIEPEIAKRSRFNNPHLSAILSDNLHFSSAEFPAGMTKTLRTQRIEASNNKCLHLYIECNAKSNNVKPLKTLSAGSEVKPHVLEVDKMKPSIKTYDQPNVVVHPQLPSIEKAEVQKNLTILVHNKLHEAVEELHWPWIVDVYANGKLWCIGILLDKYWIMVHESCHFGIRLESDYIAALFGGGKTKNIHHQSPNEVIRRIDCFERVPNSDIMLYHLEQPVHFSHHILPTFLPDGAVHNSNTMSEACLAILHDNQHGRIKTVHIVDRTNSTDNKSSCEKTADISCYQLVENNLFVKLIQGTEGTRKDLSGISEGIYQLSNEEDTATSFTNCSQFGVKKNSNPSEYTIEPIDQGVVVCRDIGTGWYPTAFFSYNNTDCSSFKQPFAIRKLEKFYKIVQEIIDNPKCKYRYDVPDCQTLRCPLGECLPKDRVCNQQIDCHDGSDERMNMCLGYKKGCKSSEIKCRSSQKCIPKSKFCDHNPDCEDLTDEPTICSCFTYLHASDPSKICDGVRNCWDKSDESPVLCNCTADHFQCGASLGECIPRDFVCDKEPDCPNGDDEKYCFGIEHPIPQDFLENVNNHGYKRPPPYGQVIEQTYGVWHTKCFPRSSPPNLGEVRQICRQLGYNPYRRPSYRLIDDDTNAVVETNETADQRGRSFGDDNGVIVGKYRASTKAVVASKFSPLRLNDEFTLFMKPSRPIAELMRWNTTDSNKCYRMEIRCL